MAGPGLWGHEETALEGKACRGADGGRASANRPQAAAEAPGGREGPAQPVLEADAEDGEEKGGGVASLKQIFKILSIGVGPSSFDVFQKFPLHIRGELEEHHDDEIISQTMRDQAAQECEGSTVRHWGHGEEKALHTPRAFPEQSALICFLIHTRDLQSPGPAGGLRELE